MDLREQKSQRVHFGFIYYGDTITPSVFHDLGVHHFETAVDEHKANFFLFKCRPVRKNQVLKFIEYWNEYQISENKKIKLQGIPHEEDKVFCSPDRGMHLIGQFIDEQKKAKARGLPSTYTCWTKEGQENEEEEEEFMHAIEPEEEGQAPQAPLASAAPVAPPPRPPKISKKPIKKSKTDRLQKELEMDLVHKELPQGKRPISQPDRFVVHVDSKRPRRLFSGKKSNVEEEFYRQLQEMEDEMEAEDINAPPSPGCDMENDLEGGSEKNLEEAAENLLNFSDQAKNEAGKDQSDLSLFKAMHDKVIEAHGKVFQAHDKVFEAHDREVQALKIALAAKDETIAKIEAGKVDTVSAKDAHIDLATKFIDVKMAAAPPPVQ